MHVHCKGENRVERANLAIIEFGSGQKQTSPTKGIKTPLESCGKPSMRKERNITDQFCKIQTCSPTFVLLQKEEEQSRTNRKFNPHVTPAPGIETGQQRFGRAHSSLRHPPFPKRTSHLRHPPSPQIKSRGVIECENNYAQNTENAHRNTKWLPYKKKFKNLNLL